MMSVPLELYQALAGVLFCIGVMGVLIRRNILVIFMCVELMLNAANISLVAFGRALGSPDGQVLVFFVLAVAAAEVSVGLAIIIDLFRKRSTVDINEVSLLRG
jgi:NADH-quinone oxidoreductase subunit K